MRNATSRLAALIFFCVVGCTCASVPHQFLAACTLALNENAFLPEWLAFHQLQGFDKFYVYDGGSRSPSLFLQIFVDDGTVDLVDWSSQCADQSRPGQAHGFVACQKSAFIDCMHRASTQWLAVFDVDEFLFAVDAKQTVASVLQSNAQHADGVSFVGAVFGNNGHEQPFYAGNATDVPLVIRHYVRRQPVTAAEGLGNANSAQSHRLWAHKEIARLDSVDRTKHGVHGFVYIKPDPVKLEMHAGHGNAPLRMHHYQYRSTHDSVLKAARNGNPDVAIAHQQEHDALLGAVVDTTLLPFGERVKHDLMLRQARDPDGVHPRAITMVLTSIGRVDLLERTLRSFVKYNTYPIARGIIVEDSGHVGIADFAKSLLDFPVDIVYNEAVHTRRAHKVGVKGLIACIDTAYSMVRTEFIFHMEDDWEFTAPAFIEPSIDILDSDPKLIQVWLRPHSDAHPVLPTAHHTPHNRTYYHMATGFGEWHGFTFNPALKRLQDYTVLNGTFFEVTKPHRQQIAGELDVNLLYHRMGYVAATTDVSAGFVRHIGGGRTTDPGCSMGC